MHPGRGHRSPWAGPAVALVLAVTGCGSGDAGPAAAAPPPGTPASSSAAPAPGLAAVAGEPGAGLHGRLLQYRRDVPARRLQVELVAGNAGLVVEALDLVAPGVPTAPADPRGAELRPGAGLALPVVAAASDCATAPGPPHGVVRLRDATGAQRQVDVPLDDGGLVARLHEADCAEQELARQVRIEASGVREVDGAEGPALDLTVRLTRLAGSDPLRVTGVGSNTVYAVDATGPLPTLDDEPAVEVVLRMRPSRCDVHALGESYRTGLVGLVVALGDAEPRPVVVTPDPEVRRRLETFAVETCRAGTD
ncbi:hypothetical protein ACI780_22475 [Geodermatophilus sp. SYSU D00814]